MRRFPAIALTVLSVCIALGASGCASSEPDGVAAPEPQDATGSPAEVTGETMDEAADESDAATAFALASPSFTNGTEIPARFARPGVEGGENISPALSWTDSPQGVGSFALVMVDRHPIAREWVHWMVVDISAQASGLEEGASGDAMPAGARELQNTWGEPGYGGPQPPSGSGEHVYEVTLYAMDIESLDLPPDAGFADFLEIVRDHMLGAATLSGTFER